MNRHENQTLWMFKTARFTLRLTWDYDYDVDFSFDDTGEILKRVQSGEYVCAVMCMSLELDGREIASDYLGGCIYADLEDFRKEHLTPGEHGSYFRDMVASVIADARKALANVPRLRAA